LAKRISWKKIPTFEIDDSSTQDDEYKAEVLADLYQKHKVQTPIDRPTVCKLYGKTQPLERI